MGNKSIGLYPEGKFIVRRRDGTDATGGKHNGCQYFVLDITHDQHAIPALRAYSSSARNDGYKLLADDLDAMAVAAPPSTVAPQQSERKREIFDAGFAKSVPASPAALRDETRSCAKCGHLQDDVRRRGTDLHGSFCIYGCGCECEFPATPPSCEQ